MIMQLLEEKAKKQTHEALVGGWNESNYLQFYIHLQQRNAEAS